MKKVLLISYLYPPFNQIGAKRAYFFSKYLSKLGFQVQVLSSELPENFSRWDVDCSTHQVYRIPIRDLRLVRHEKNAVLARFYQFFNDLFSPIDASARIQVEDIDFEQLSKPDIIIATGGPWHSLQIGAGLKKHWPEAKLILDYRDAWNIHDKSVAIDSLNNFGQGLDKLKAAKTLKAEKEALEVADAVIGVTQPIVENVINHPKFKSFNPENYRVIYNGFEANDDEPVYDKNQFIISYTGILRQEQEHELFLKGFEKFMQNPEVNPQDVLLLFVGSDHPRLQHLLAPFKQSSFAKQIEVTPFLDRAEVRKYQDKSSLFINFSYTGKRGIMSGKIFEYLELKKPMLIVSKNDDEMEKLLRMTETGDIGKDVESIAEILGRRYREWKENKIHYQPNAEGMDFFRNDYQVKQLAEFIESI